MCHDDLKVSDARVMDQDVITLADFPPKSRRPDKSIFAASQRARDAGEALVFRRLCVAPQDPGPAAVGKRWCSRTLKQGRVWWSVHLSRKQGARHRSGRKCRLR